MGIDLTLSAWEVCSVAARLPADRLTCGSTVLLSVSDRGCPRWLLRSGTERARPTTWPWRRLPVDIDTGFRAHVIHCPPLLRPGPWACLPSALSKIIPCISRVSLSDTAAAGYTPVWAISRPEFTASVKA